MPATKTKTKKTRHLSWPEGIERFETHLLACGRAARTVADYLRELRLLEQHLAPLARPVGPAQTTIEHLRAYQAGLMTGEASQRGRPQTAGTVAKVTAVLATFFGWLLREGLIATDPMARLERPKIARPVGDVLSIGEAKRLLAQPCTRTALGLRDRAVLELLYGAGPRRNELLALDLSDVRHEGREIVVRHGKGDKARITPVGRGAWKALTDYLERGRPSLAGRAAGAECAVFVTAFGQRLKATRLRVLLQGYADAAGIGRRLTPHSLRRTYATHLIQGGVSVRHVQVLLGHESLETTARYLRLTTAEIRKEVLLKHPRERFE
jgi:integrase/recombinase XerD